LAAEDMAEHVPDFSPHPGGLALVAVEHRPQISQQHALRRVCDGDLCRTLEGLLGCFIVFHGTVRIRLAVDFL
jgi:hypothetical protein